MFKSAYVSLLIASLITLLFMSCNNGTTTHEVQQALKSSDSIPPLKPAAVTAIAGYMDTLYMERETFLKLKDKRLVLKYYVNAQGALTLHGWQTKRDISNDEYDPKELELSNGNPSLENPYGPGSFFGGVVLKKRQITDIKDSITSPVNTQMNYVIFAPQKDPDHMGHFMYVIMLANYEPLKIKSDMQKDMLAPKTTNIIANPSPPRNS